MRTVYTDGSALPNPGVGGFAVIENGEAIILGAEEKSTNIRMEAAAIIAAMEKLGEVTIYTDSQFWVNVITKWSEGWRKKGWRKSDGKPVENIDLVKRMYELYHKGGVEMVWVRGHNGLEYNEIADEMANKARKRDVPDGFKQGELEGLKTILAWVREDKVKEGD